VSGGNEMTWRKPRILSLAAGLGLLALVATACSSSTNTGTSATVPSNISVSSFDVSFNSMSSLKNLTAAGKGLVGVILPDTTSSTRYVNFDQPYLQKAFEMAGYKSTDFKIDNAQGNDATELAQAQADITQGATVLVMDPLDSTVGSQIQQLAQSHGVKVISYDRATFTGNKTYYVSFDNVQVGKLIGQGFEDCITAWNVQKPQVFVLNGGEDTDPNAVSFAQGYNQVIWGDQTTPQQVGKTNGKGYTLVGDQVAPGWDNSKGQTIFQQQFTAHPTINATVEANDGLANAVVQVLQHSGVPANKIPTTGQDATLDGMVNVLQGYQCGSVYKAVYLEAQDAVALATILRANQTPPSSLVNGTTSPPAGKPGSTQPASLLTPTWVDKSKVASTVIKDKFVDAATLCQKVGASVCSANGISTS
jgi:D-xylose transport system substrate-binding protein